MTAITSQNIPGAVIGAVATGVDTIGALIKDGDFIGKEVEKMKKWDETHNKDGSLKNT